MVIKGDTRNLDHGSHGAPGYGALEHDYCYGYNHGYRYLYTPYGIPFIYATAALIKGVAIICRCRARIISDNQTCFLTSSEPEKV